MSKRVEIVVVLFYLLLDGDMLWENDLLWLN
jgi:hypothetical protein